MQRFLLAKRAWVVLFAAVCAVYFFGLGATPLLGPDFANLAQAFGIPGFRCETVDDFPAHLDKALSLDEPSIVVVPIDYSQDIGLQEQLGKETVAA